MGTMETAGRAVVFSGIAVALGLALLLAMPLPFIRMLGVAGFLIPIVSIAAAVTLQPVLLSFYGRRGTVRRRVLPRREARPGRARRAPAVDHGEADRLPRGRDGGARRDGPPRVLDPAHSRIDLRDPPQLAVGPGVRPPSRRRSTTRGRLPGWEGAGVPWFSTSTLRYGVGALKTADISGVEVFGPGPLEEHHQIDLSWYAIHEAEMLFALLGRSAAKPAWPRPTLTS